MGQPEWQLFPESSVEPVPALLTTALESSFDTKSNIKPWLRPLLDELDQKYAEDVKRVTGQSSYTLSDILALLAALVINPGTVPYAERVDLIRMGIFRMRSLSDEGWEFAAENLEYWLMAGLKSDPTKYPTNEAFVNNAEIAGNICAFHGPKIKEAIELRLTSPVDTLFPTDVSKPIHLSTGEEWYLSQAPSSLPGGGEETLYYESSIDAGWGQTGLVDAYGRLAIVSEVTVNSTKLSEGHWRVKFVSWRCWAFDEYNWDKDGKAIPLGLISFLSPELETVLQYFEVEADWLDRLPVPDEWLNDMDGQGPITPIDGDAVYPLKYKIYVAPWEFDLTLCPYAQEFEFPP